MEYIKVNVYGPLPSDNILTRRVKKCLNANELTASLSDAIFTNASIFMVKSAGK